MTAPNRLDPTRLILDMDGRYIRGPKRGKGALLRSLGAVRVEVPETPEAWLPPGALLLVCLIDRGHYEAARVILDRTDLARCVALEGMALLEWYALPRAIYDEAQHVGSRLLLPEEW